MLIRAEKDTGVNHTLQYPIQSRDNPKYPLLSPSLCRSLQSYGGTLSDRLFGTVPCNGSLRLIPTLAVAYLMLWIGTRSTKSSILGRENI